MDIKMTKKLALELDYETADKITRLNLTDARDYMIGELQKFNDTLGTDNPYWMHPEDVVNNQVLIKHINAILDYYGGELYGERETGQPD